MDYEDRNEFIDIDATVEALREAWKLMPHAELSEVLDTIAPMPFVELSNAELIENFNSFIHQNR